MQDGQCFHVLTVEGRTLEREYGLLPTITANEGEFMLNGNIRSEETWETTKRIGHFLIGMVCGLKGREKYLGKKAHTHPSFAEWMMGFPSGWSDLKPVEMPKFQSWLQQHSAFLRDNKEG